MPSKSSAMSVLLLSSLAELLLSNITLSKYKFSLLGLLIVFVMIVTSVGKTVAEDQ